MEYNDISNIYGVNKEVLRKRKERFSHIRGLPQKVVLRKSKVTAYWGLQIKESVHEEPKLSYRDRFWLLEPPFSKNTMVRYMMDNGIKTFKRHKQIVFTERHKRDRIDFANRMLERFDEDPDFWKRIIWSDEKMFKFREFDSKMEYFGWASRPDMFILRKRAMILVFMFGECSHFTEKGPWLP